MSGRDEGAACTTVTNESDDMFAMDCMERPDLQTPCDTTVALETSSKHHALSVASPQARKSQSALSRQQNLVGLLHG